MKLDKMFLDCVENLLLNLWIDEETETAQFLREAVLMRPDQERALRYLGAWHLGVWQ